MNMHHRNILKIYGISQNPDTKDYVMVLQYAKGGNFNDWINKNCKNFTWLSKIQVLFNIIGGLKEIHQKQIVHRDFHTGNILLSIMDINPFTNNSNFLRKSTLGYISDMGLSGEVNNIDKTKIYGVIPYVAPEVLRGQHYAEAADIYSFGMVMYFVATGRQPFANCAHDHQLALDMCKGIRPEISEEEAPKCYNDLMKECWDSNPDKRPNTIKVYELIKSFRESFNETEKQFTEAEKNRKANLLSIENYQSTTHPQAIYTSRLLNPFTESLKFNFECLDSEITD
jgi:serine/threonine protein kinase